MPPVGVPASPVRQEYKADLLALTGAALHHVRLDPQDPQVMYAVGNRGVWKSANGGDSWAMFKAFELSQDVAIAPNDSRTVYLATRRAIHKTRNGGESWETLPGVEGAQTLLINPSNAAELYATGTGGVNYSSDGGASWRKLAISGTDASLWDIDVDFSAPSERRAILAGENDAVALWRSADGGNSWKQVFKAGGGRTAVKMARGDPRIIYASKGVSRDGGATWSEAPAAWGIGVHPDNPQVAYYGDAASLQVTTDGGRGFVDVAPQINYNAGEAEGFAFNTATDTLYLASSSLFRGAGAKSGRVRLTDASQGMYGLDLTDLETTPWAVWASSDTQGIHRSEDRGVTWRQTILGTFGRDSIRNLAPHPTDPNVVYAGHETNIFKTVDGGRTWSKLVSAWFPQLTLDPERPSTVYYGTRGEGTREEQIYRSEDGGASWILLGQGGQRVFLHPRDAATIYTISGGNLFRSTNRGDSWNQVGQIPGSMLYVLPSNPAVMFAPADTDGLHRSTDGGATWTKQGVLPKRPRRVLELGDGSLWLASLDRGLFRSLDHGDSWEPMAEMAATMLAPDPGSPDALYAATSGAEAGVWWVHPPGKTLPKSEPPREDEPSPATVRVDSCQVLDRSNTVYQVTRNLKPLGMGSCFLFTQGAANITLDGQGHTVEFGSTAIFGGELENVVIKDLVLNQAGEEGLGLGAVVLSNIKGLKVVGNTINTNPRLREQHGIVVSGVFSQDVEISDNDITVARFATGISVSAERAVVRQNRVTGGPPGTHGIVVVGSPGAVVEGNQVTGAGGGAYFGIRVLSSPRASVTGNRVTGTYSRGGSGLQVLDSADAVTSGNTLP